MRKRNRNTSSITVRGIVLLMALAAGIMLFAERGRAQCLACEVGDCVFPQRDETMLFVMEQHFITRFFITEQFRFHQNWLFGSGQFYQNGVRDSFWELHVQVALMMMAEQLVTVGMEQMLILGSFFDAKQQLETQRLFQKKSAEAHKDYHSSFEMCEIGTTVRSMAAADRNGEYVSFLLGQRAQDRALGVFANGSPDSSIDREGRIRQVKARYCDPNDNSRDLDELCGAGGPNVTINYDVDWPKLIDQPRALNIDYTDAAMTHDEIDVLALLTNLTSHETMDKPKRTPGDMETAEGVYMEMRSLFAKRSVVETSLNAIIGLKAKGSDMSPRTMDYILNFIMQEGWPNPDWAAAMAGGYIDTRWDPNWHPSYYSMLELIAQKIYLDEKFYSNLYDKPANVLRKDVAMQAINLMLERDMHKSELRQEMVYSVWLELELMKYQGDIQNRLNSMREQYQEN